MLSVKLAVALASCLMLSACFGSSTNPDPTPPQEPPISGDIIRYNHLGLDDLIVTSMLHVDGSIWVAGDQGVFVSRNPEATNAAEAAWVHQLQGVYVTQITGFNGNELFAIAQTGNSGPGELYRSSNGGESWQLIDHDFGGKDEVNSTRLQALYPESASGYLYGAGQQALAVSYDQGQQWQLLAGEWGMVSATSVLVIHPQYQDAWLGGQSAIEQSTLVRYQLSGSGSEQWDNLIPAPSANKSIRFDSNNPDHVLVGAEGGIIASGNYGAQWSTVLADEDYGFYSDILQSTLDARVFYTGRWQKGLQHHPLRLSYSLDHGERWQHSQHPSTDRHYGVTAMVLLEPQQQQDVLWIGLSNGMWEGGGVMRANIDLDIFHQ